MSGDSLEILEGILRGGTSISGIGAANVLEKTRNELADLRKKLEKAERERDAFAAALDVAKKYVPGTDSLYEDCQNHNRAECQCQYCSAYRDAELVEATDPTAILATRDQRIRREFVEKAAERAIEWLSNQKYGDEHVLHAIVCCDWVSRSRIIKTLADELSRLAEEQKKT